MPHRRIAGITASVALLLSVMSLGASTAYAVSAPSWQWTGAGWDRTSSPTIADINGDGINDIVVGSEDGWVRVFQHDGSQVPGWPQPEIVRPGAAPTAVDSSPAVGDLDGDGKPEIVVGAGSTLVPNQPGGIVVFSSDGSVRCRWEGIDNMTVWGMITRPDGFGEGVYSTPALGDVNGDGKLDIVFGGWDAHVHALDASCHELPGFPWFSGDTVWSSPALYDIDGDGRPEIFIGGDGAVGWPGGVFQALDWRNGAVVPIWEQRTLESTYSSPAIGDIDGDGRLEAIVGQGDFYATTQHRTSDSNKVFAWHLDDGSPVRGWPRDLGGITFSSPAIGDIDGDGKPDVVVGSRNGWVHALRGDGSPIWETAFGSPLPTTNASAVIGDVNGDGKPEVVFPNDYGVYILDGRTGAITTSFGTLESYGATPAIADFGRAGWAVVTAGFNTPNHTTTIASYPISRPGATPPWPMWRKNALRLGTDPSGGDPLPPNFCRRSVNPPATPNPNAAKGYWMLGADGAVYALDAPFSGSLGSVGIRGRAVGIEPTASGGGYWVLAADGGVFSFGDARFYGSMGGQRLNAPIINLARTSSGMGYWLLGADGGVFSFGDARFYGSMGGQRLNAPIVAITPTPSGRGYWLLASDGGIFSFGDAKFVGSTGSMKLAASVVSMAAAPSGLGYWLMGSDGGVFSFGVPFYGSAPGTGLCTTARTMQIRPTNTGAGYYVLAADGGVMAFGDAPFHGAAPGRSIFNYAVDLALKP